MTLEPFILNAIVGKWAVLEVVEERAAELDSKQLFAMTDSLRDTIMQEIQGQLDDPLDLPFDEYMQGLIGALRTRVWCPKTSTGKEVLDQVLENVEERLLALKKLGEDPLDAIFVQMLTLAVSTYSTFGVAIPGTLPSLVKFSPSWINDISGALPEPFVKLAWTTHQTDSCLVRIQLPVPTMDLPMFASLEYVMLHECIAHVLQGPYNATRVSSDPSSSFQEGWLDYIAWHVYQSYVDGLATWAPQPSLQLSTVPARRAAARRAHEARLRRVRGDPHWSGRWHGATAADMFQGYLHRIPDLASQAWTILYSLSFGINGSATPVGQRDYFAYRVGRLLGGEEWRLSRLAAFTQSIRDYTYSGDALQVVSSFT